MATIHEALEMAVGHQQAGRLNEAEQLYHDILRADPQQPDALHLLGLVWQSQGKHEAAIGSINRAVAMMPDNADFLSNLGVVCSDFGRYDEAISALQRAINIKPDYAVAYNNLGIALHRQGKHDEAVTSYQRALQIKPDYAEAHYGLGIVFQFIGTLDEAIASYQRVLDFNPDHVKALCNLGNSLKNQGRFDEAIANYQRALQIKPNHFNAHNNLGNLLKSQGKPDESVACYQRALQIKPDHADAHANLGFVFKDLGKLDESIACYQRALQIKPDHADAHNNLGVAFKELGKLDESIASIQRALQIKPDHADAHTNLGVVFKDLGKLDESIACFQRALQIKPDHADAHTNLGVVFKDLGKLDESIACFQRALQIKPDHANAHTNLGVMLLRLGRFEEGWVEYEYRFESMGHEGTELPFPRWDGRAVSTGESILLLSEQGLGDTLQFIRYATFLNQSRGFRVICAVQPALLTILSTVPGIEQLVPNREPLPAADCWSHLLSLPGLCGHHSPTDLPVAESWVTADPGLVEHWCGKLARHSGFRVGIAWQGSRKHKDDRRRSVPLEQFEPVARLDGVTLISLQQGPGSEQLETVGQDLGVVSLGDDVDGPAGAFMDTAAIMKGLDLVISTDTAIVHLAGSLGVPVWVPLGIAPDWRWQLTGSTTPWYPSMRLFRQPKPGDWDSVFGQIVDELLKLELSIQRTLPSSRPILKSGPNSLVRARHGLMLANRNDRYIGRSVLKYGEFSEPEVELFRQFITSGNTVVEAGANIGTHTLPFAQSVGPSGRVYAFEPQRIVHQMLCSNITLNGLTNVICRQDALGETPGTTQVPALDFASENNFGGVSLDSTRVGETVPVTTVDSLGFSACHFLKVDVEGMELAVIRGAAKTITQFHPVLYIENDREKHSQQLLQHLLDLDYRLFWHTPHMYQADNYFGNTENLFPGIVSINVLGVHPSTRINITDIAGLRQIASADCSWRS